MSSKYLIYGARSVYCGLCHASPSACRCDDTSLTFLGCPHCNRPKAICDADTHGCGTTPARDDAATMPYGMWTREDLEQADRDAAALAGLFEDAPPSGYMSRPPLL